MNAAGSSHRMSRFVTGAMSEMLPKCSAVSGTVNTMAPRLIAATPKKGAAHRRALLGTCASQALLHRCPKSRMPKVDRKENCRPALAAA